MKTFWKYTSIIDKLNILFLIVVILFYVVSLPRSPYWWQPPLIFVLTAATVALSVFLRRKNLTAGWAKAFRLAYPLIYLFVIFESFFMILPYFNLNRYDHVLAEIDFTLFGVYPTVWIEQWNTPWLTDFFYTLYIFYFPMPLFILRYLYRQKRFRELDRSVFVYLLTYYGAYLVYFFVPAAGPRFYEPLLQLQKADLDGLWLAVPIRLIINILEPNKLDAFPSLHAAISFTTLLLMGKYNRKMFFVFLPIIAGVMVSLVYCRYHYVIDMIAGIFWSSVTFMAGHNYYDKFVAGKQLPFYFEQHDEAY